MRTLYELSDNVFVTHIDMSIFSAIYVGALHVGDEIVEICGISVQGRTVDYLQKMLVSILRICCVSVSDEACCLFVSVVFYLEQVMANFSPRLSED